MNAVAYVAFAVMFLICTVVFLGLVLVAWLGWILGLLWMAVATPFVLFILGRLCGFTSLRNTDIPGDREGRSR